MSSNSKFQSNLSTIFSQHFDAVERSISKSAEFQEGSLPAIRVDVAQDVIRPLFGKSGKVSLDYGDHPDFNHLKDTLNVEKSPITTLFVDIEASTRLGVVFSPEEAFLYKNAIITSVIDIVNAFDGHVHRIMGDAVMAFFGRKGTKVENGIIDGLNCATFLRLFIKEEVLSRLEEEGLDRSYGIRIGLDYGEEEDVLWGSYGHERISEVTATSFHVDTSAKLQQAARRNRIMLGESLRKKIDFPEDLIAVPKKGDNKQYYLEPNYSDKDGNPVCYRQYELEADKYLKITPLASQLEAADPSFDFVPVIVPRVQYPNAESKYAPSSRILEKGRAISFEYHLANEAEIGYPFEVIAEVENHGEEARAKNSKSDKNQLSYNDGGQTINGQLVSDGYVYNNSTAYRGLHYLTLRFVKDGNGVCKRKVGVYIE